MPVLVNPSRFTVISGGPSGYPAAVLADSPALYWRLGDTSGTTITDSSGNSRNGTYANSPTLGAAGALSDSSTGVTFNGTNQDGTIAFSAWMTSSTVTYEAWYKGTGTSQIIFGRRSSTTIGYIAVDATGKAFFQSRRSNGTNLGVTGTSTVNDGNWHHIAGVANGTQLRIHVDGSLEATANNGFSIATDTTNGISVASRGSAFLAGSVDECAFWTVALTTDQILAHYVAR